MVSLRSVPVLSLSANIRLVLFLIVRTVVPPFLYTSLVEYVIDRNRHFDILRKVERCGSNLDDLVLHLFL